MAEKILYEDRRVEIWFQKDQSNTKQNWDDVNSKRQEVRHAFLSAYRHQFGLGAAKAIEARLWMDDES